MNEPPKLEIPDVKADLPPRYVLAERLSFSPPQAVSFAFPAVKTWNTAGAPELVFGAPDGWSEVPAHTLTWFAAERDNTPPGAPILQDTRILAAFEHPGAGGIPWLVQLRNSANPVGHYVMRYPGNWADAKSRWCEFQGPINRGVAGEPAIILRYAYSRENVVLVLYEAWLLYGGGGYHFVLSAPAADESELWPDWEAILASARPGASPQTRPVSQPRARPVPPVPRYRCAIATQVPVTLGNVASQSPGAIKFGSVWELLGTAAVQAYGSAKAARLEGQTVWAPATGEAVLTDDGVQLHLVVAPKVGRTHIRGGPSDRSADLHIPYRLIGRCGSDHRGVWLDVTSRGTLWLHPQDRGEFAQWLAHLSYGKTWQPPVRVAMQVNSPVAGWCQQDPRFTFGLPQRWVQAPPHALADYGRLFAPSVLRAGVVEAAGEWEAQVFVIDNGPVAAPGGRADEQFLAVRLAEAPNISPQGPIEVTTVDGELAALLRSYSWQGGEAVDRCYGAFAHADTMYALWYGVVGGTTGDGSYENWLPAFHTMLATWHWYA
jgi:hypothetical protein